MGNILGLGRGKRAAKQAFAGFDFLKDNPLINQSQQAGSQATSSLAGILGLGGDPAAQSAALNTFFDNPGFKFLRDQALQGVESSAAAAGKLNSGATLKALQDRAGGLAATQLPTFLQSLFGLQGAGQQAALGTGAAGTSGGGSAAAAQPQNTGIFGRLFGI